MLNILRYWCGLFYPFSRYIWINLELTTKICVKTKILTGIGINVSKTLNNCQEIKKGMLTCATCTKT
jgi:hypothetical protein